MWQIVAPRCIIRLTWGPFIAFEAPRVIADHPRDFILRFARCRKRCHVQFAWVRLLQMFWFETSIVWVLFSIYTRCRKMPLLKWPDSFELMAGKAPVLPRSFPPPLAEVQPGVPQNHVFFKWCFSKPQVKTHKEVLLFHLHVQSCGTRALFELRNVTLPKNGFQP